MNVGEILPVIDGLQNLIRIGDRLHAFTVVIRKTSRKGIKAKDQMQRRNPRGLHSRNARVMPVSRRCRL
jgi:hypothetical protein